MKPLLIKLAKFGVSAAIITYLVIDARKDQAFADLLQQPKQWGVLAAASVVLLAGVILTFFRWHILVRALDLPFTLRDAFRLGFLGFLFNFVSLGSVGGDLFKAIFIAREHPRRRAEAVATVIVDRVVGLYALFVVAAFFVLVFGQLNAAAEEIRLISRVTLIGTVVGGLGIALVMSPGFTRGRFATWLMGLPRVGQVCRKLLAAVRMYREKPLVLAAAWLMSVGVHVLSVIGIYLIGRGLPGQIPTFSDHFLIVPVSMLAAALPLPLNGLGAFEGVMDFLFRHVPSQLVVHKGEGLLVSFGYRAVTILIAMIGVCVYLTHRREVGDVLDHADEEEAADEAAFDRPDMLSSGSAPA